SIVYVGFENIRSRKTARDWRMRIAFGFGLIHGFGFASVLREFGLPHEALAWSLLGFNLGVEIGQACIVLAVTPALYALRRWVPPRRLRPPGWAPAPAAGRGLGLRGGVTRRGGVVFLRGGFRPSLGFWPPPVNPGVGQSRVDAHFPQSLTPTDSASDVQADCLR